MDPCSATGAAAALDLAGAGSVHQIDNAALRERVKDKRGADGPGRAQEKSRLLIAACSMSAFHPITARERTSREVRLGSVKNGSARVRAARPFGAVSGHRAR